MRRAAIDPYDYVNRSYGVGVKVGQRVTVDGKPGVVTRPHGSSAHVMVRFDGARHAAPCHPTWRINYAPEERAAGG